MATHQPKQELDFSKMSVEEMIALSRQLQEAAQQQSQKLFDETMTFLNDKLTAMGRSRQEAVLALFALMDNDDERGETLDALQHDNKTQGPPKTRAKRGEGKPRKAQPYEKGVVYKDGPDTWIGGTQGRRPKWLQGLIPDTMTFEEAQAAYKRLAT